MLDALREEFQYGDSQTRAAIVDMFVADLALL
jgi:hypothetical protein